jgi:hypothetical protein
MNGKLKEMSLSPHGETPARYLLEDIVQIAQFGVVAHRDQAGQPSGLRHAEQLAESIVRKGS